MASELELLGLEARTKAEERTADFLRLQADYEAELAGLLELARQHEARAKSLREECDVADLLLLTDMTATVVS